MLWIVGPDSEEKVLNDVIALQVRDVYYFKEQLKLYIFSWNVQVIVASFCPTSNLYCGTNQYYDKFTQL